MLHIRTRGIGFRNRCQGRRSMISSRYLDAIR
jgi:hypothetical protein